MNPLFYMYTVLLYIMYIVDDAIRYANLDIFSAFRIENHFSSMKRLIRRGKGVIKQLASRNSEIKLYYIYINIIV